MSEHTEKDPVTNVQAVDQRDEFEQRWACEPPPEGSRFKVVRDEWSDDNGRVVRTIFEWEM